MATHRSNESMFRWKVSVFSGMTFWASGMTPLILDPRLAHHVRYGARKYPHWYFYELVVLSFLVFVFTFLVFEKIRPKTRVYFAIIPIWIFSTPMFWMLRPEVPHAGFMDPLIIASILFFITVWARDIEVGAKFIDSPNILVQVKVERVKEEIALWRTGVIALLGSYLALVIAWFNSIRESNKDVTIDKGEQFLLNTNGIILVAIQSVWFFGCVLPEMTNKAFEALKLLERIQGPRIEMPSGQGLPIKKIEFEK